ncbi:MAG: tRNA-dihydrouridine synthase family protein [Spirochaetes bacterium]|nr:tRNA-dihydrouridine synthase family protein [Spirochaetota bacterium]
MMSDGENNQQLSAIIIFMIISGKEYTFHFAPMAEISTPALRKVIKQWCPNVVLYSEMLASGAINAKAPHNEPLITRYQWDSPFFYQLVGNNPNVMAQAALILQDYGCDGININMACSAPHIVKGGGAKLLCEATLAKEIIKACRKVVKGLLTVKIRAGFYDIDIPYITQFIYMLQEEGIDAVIIHPRAAKWGYTRSAQWNVIEAIVTDVKIPVIGNGDIVEPQQALARLQRTRCDGIMIGRAAVQKPWIFAQCDALFGQKPLSLSLNIEEIWIEVLQNIQKMLPKRLHKSRAHRFCAYYHKNIRFGHQLFSSIRQHADINSMIALIKDYFIRNEDERMKVL